MQLIPNIFHPALSVAALSQPVIEQLFYVTSFTL